ncbi:SDR family oxidoreductase [Arthrobacter sp. ATA002]|uniref:SDR family oxidoreductase n=1 Tax=Arthrobacter sp. ATA002 TaxID=2991715 RepID=UPI0022A744E4|nr:SDR family oxidoreductase [Arthrobacter sp. ATA002]WAP50772.1 SDR family oxidoreductase [Arthrobacter sp. ATA002]
MTTQASPGPVAVITGASSGIGEATARELTAAGYRVALLARRTGRLDALAAELGDGALPIQADVTRRDDLEAAAGRVKSELGGTDVLVNNAGVMLLGAFGPDRHSDYRNMVDVNLLGAITATEVFLDQLRDGGGDLVNMSSVAGRTARPGDAVYAATKWGLIGFSECMRQELLPDVRVTVVEPGYVATDLPTHITDDEARRSTEELYSHVTATPGDVARVIAFVLAQPRHLSVNEVVVRPSDQRH